MLLSAGDGYVRMTFAQLKSIRLAHLLSGLDNVDDIDLHDGPLANPITGYTEWINHGRPAITIGWDWVMRSSRSPLILTLISEPRSNIMLQGSCQSDLGPDATRVLLAEFVGGLAWQTEVADFLKLRYE
jgi:hypothetical protein